MLDIDKLNNVSVHGVGNAAFTVIDRLQHHRPEAQVVGAAFVVLALADRYGVDPRRMLQIATNIAYEGERLRPELRAVRAYVRGEL